MRPPCAAGRIAVQELGPTLAASLAETGDELLLLCCNRSHLPPGFMSWARRGLRAVNVEWTTATGARCYSLAMPPEQQQQQQQQVQPFPQQEVPAADVPEGGEEEAAQDPQQQQEEMVRALSEPELPTDISLPICQHADLALPNLSCMHHGGALLGAYSTHES